MYYTEFIAAAVTTLLIAEVAIEQLGKRKGRCVFVLWQKAASCCSRVNVFARHMASSLFQTS